MSTNGQLVFTDVDKITFKGVGNASNAVIDTLTGKIGVGVDSPEANLHVVGNSYVSTNLELGGTLIMGTVNVEAQHSLEAVTATGNTTPLTLEFTNPTTSLVASGNVEVAGNVTAGYLYGDGSNISGISSTLQAITDSGNVTSNTVQFTNATTSLVASGNVEVGGELIVSGNIYNNANLSVQYTTITPTLWTQVGQDIDGEAADDQSGFSVSISSDGTRVAIGAPYNDGTGIEAGHVRVFYDNNGTWEQVGQDIEGEAAGDESGNSVSMSSDGTRVAIGAKYNDGTGSAAGHVRVYSESGGTWTQVGQDIDGEAAGDESGYSVSMSSDGTRVAIGAARNDGTGSDAGHVRVYAESGGLWTKVGGDIDGEVAGDWSGWLVSMSSDGTRVAIGAPYNNGNGSDAGHVRVYAESSGTWTQVGADIDGEAADDRSGWSVSMSSDGTRVAIGAPYNHGNGSDAGHVRVFYDNNGTWEQVGQDIDGEAVDDRFGHSVSMSSNGTRVAIGAKQNDGNGSNSGHVRVFDWPVKSKKILKDDIVEVGGELTVSGNVGIGTSSPIAALDIDGGPENDTVPALSIRGGLYDTSDLYVLNTYNVNTGVGYAAKVIGVNIKNKVETDNTVQLRNNVGGLTSAGAIYLGSDNTTSQGVFGVLTCQGIAGTTLTEKFTVTDSGNVGIGTTSPAIQLDVRGTNAKLGRVLTGNVHEVYKRDSVDIGRWDDTTLSDGFSGMRCRVDTHTALGYGSYSNQTEIGFYAWGNSIAGSRQVFAINAYGNGNMIGTLTQSSNGTTSDDRIKYNEEDITSPLTLISQLNPQKYEKIVSVAVSEKEGIWIPTDEEWESVKSEYTYVDEFGFIAQDVRAVPELSFLVNGEETRTDTNTLTPEEYSNLTSEEQVTYTPSYVYESNTITQQEYSNLTHEEQGVCTTQYTKQIETQTPLSLNYNGLFVLAIGAIKELKAENDAIKARLDALENA